MDCKDLHFTFQQPVDDPIITVENLPDIFPI